MVEMLVEAFAWVGGIIGISLLACIVVAATISLFGGKSK